MILAIILERNMEYLFTMDVYLEQIPPASQTHNFIHTDLIINSFSYISLRIIHVTKA